jgi:tetratricopeptide (TPR) repeat protein
MPDLAASSGDGSKNSIDVKGDRNLAIVQNFGNAFGNIEGNVYLNQQPKFLSLHQLPSDIADFTGRTTEIETIRQQLLGGKSLVISAVAGMAGVGKSALAIHVAQQLAESDYPDVQLYVDLRGADEDGLEPGEVLARWLRAFGLDESNMPIDLQERASVYRSQLAGKRAIVLLDNVRDEAQVRPLLPGNGCAVIITSRRVLGALDGATILNLQVLSDPDDRDLLAKLVGVERLEAEPEAAAETIRLCGGLPLAIRIVGGTLKQKLHWRLAEYCQKLTDEKARLAHLELSDLAVRASFELSYRELSATDGMLFSRLGILVGKDFGAELAAVVQELEHPVIEGIERLIDAQLLEVNADRRYRFHDLLRLFAREKLAGSTSAEDQEGIRQQIVDWGQQQSDVMDSYLRPVERRQVVQQLFESGAVAVEQVLGLSALAWFEQEREQLLNAIDWAKGRERWDMVISLAENLILFFEGRSYLQDWEKTCLMAVTAAQQANDLSGEGRSLNNLGMMYHSQSRWGEAIDCHQQSLTICRELGDLSGEGKSLNNLGAVYQSQSRWGEAIDCHQQSLTMKRELGDLHGEGRSLSNLGMAYHSQSRWGEAIDCFQQSLTICRELGDLHGEGENLNKLGLVYYSQSRLGEAIDCFQQSLTIKRKLGDLSGEGGSLSNLGNVYQSQSRWGEAIDCFQQSLTIERKLGDLSGEGKSLNNLGLVYYYQSRWGEAIDCFQQSLTICQELGDRYEAGKSLNNLGMVYSSQNRWGEAIDCHQKSSSICQEFGDRYGESENLNNLGVVYQFQSRWGEAIDCFQQSLTIKRELCDLSGEGRSLHNLGRVYQLQSRWRDAIDCFQQSLTIKRELGNRHGEGRTLGNLGLLYAQQGQIDLAIPLWQEALTKLPEGAAEYPIFQGWLEAVRHP